MARRHFEKEENLVYAVAQQMLDDETLDQLGKDWAAARHVKIA